MRVIAAPPVHRRHTSVVSLIVGWEFNLQVLSSCAIEPKLTVSLICCRLQDQSSPREDEHVHKDAGARRGAGVRGDGAQGGRGARQARDPLRRRALLADPRLTQVWRRAAAARRRARPRDGAGACTLPRRGARRGAQGRYYQAHPAHHPHLHRYAVARARARV